MNLPLKRTGLAAAALAMSMGLAACGTDDEGATTESAETTPQQEETEDTAAMGDEPFGPGCSAVPAEGDGSFDGMTSAPVATAASNNPVLETLVTAVSEAGLVDTLNQAPELTVFAPANDAFAAIPEEDLNALLADKDQLTKVLTHHVVGMKIAPEDLAGEHETLNGDMITVEGEGEDFTVGEASIICGNVQTANATVYIIDGVLMPAA